jgi:predicted NBD/HSP70 family sugar kinase
MSPDRPNGPPQRMATRSRVLREIRRRTVATKPELREVTGLGDNGLWRVLGQLRDELDLIAEDESGHLRLKGDRGFLVGVDMTLTEVRVVASELDYFLFGRPRASAIAVADPPATLETIADLIARAVAETGLEREALVGVGIGLPGPVSRRRGGPDSPHILPGWEKVEVRAEMTRLLGERGLADVPVLVANDASMGALGVYTRNRMLRPDDAPDDLLYVRVATGVGAGIVMKGHLVTGADGLAGEMGHIRVDARGPLCVRCNHRGCLETYAAGPAVLARIRDRAREDQRSVPVSLEAALETPDAVTLQEVKNGAWHLGLILAGVINFLNPSWIVLGGWLAEHGSYNSTVQETVRKFALDPAVQGLEVTTWETLDRGGDAEAASGLSPELLGALAHVIDELGDDFLLARLPPASAED